MKRCGIAPIGIVTACAAFLIGLIYHSSARFSSRSFGCELFFWLSGWLLILSLIFSGIRMLSVSRTSGKSAFMSKLAGNLLIFIGGLLLVSFCCCDFMVTGHISKQENAVKQQKAELEAKMNAEQAKSRQRVAVKESEP